MAESYSKWYEKHGVVMEDEVKAWVGDMPTLLDINDILGDTTDFITSTLRDAYALYVEESEFIDAQYEQRQEQELLEGYCF